MDINLETLDQLKSIKFALYLLVGLFIGILIIHISFFSFFYRDMVKKIDSKSFSRLAENLFEEGRLEDLEHMSYQKLKTHPNSVHAHYFLGKSQYNKGRYEQSKKSFEAALECEPHWEESIEPYLKKIDEKVNDS